MSPAMPLPARAGRLWYRCPLGTDDEPGQDQWPSAARRTFKFIAWRLRNGGMTLDDSDRVIADWLGVKRRVVQKGLRQLEDMEEISRHRQHGRRVITLIVPFKGPTEKPKKAPRKTAAPVNATVPFPTAPPDASAPEPEPDPEERRRAAEMAKEFVAKAKAEQATEATQQAGKRIGPTLASSVTRTPEQERERELAELARIEAIPVNQRTNLQEKIYAWFAARHGRPARE